MAASPHRKAQSAWAARLNDLDEASVSTVVSEALLLVPTIDRQVAKQVAAIVMAHWRDPGLRLSHEKGYDLPGEFIFALASALQIAHAAGKMNEPPNDEAAALSRYEFGSKLEAGDWYALNAWAQRYLERSNGLEAAKSVALLEWRMRLADRMISRSPRVIAQTDLQALLDKASHRLFETIPLATAIQDFDSNFDQRRREIHADVLEEWIATFDRVVVFTRPRLKSTRKTRDEAVLFLREAHAYAAAVGHLVGDLVYVAICGHEPIAPLATELAKRLPIVAARLRERYPLLTRDLNLERNTGYEAYRKALTELQLEWAKRAAGSRRSARVRAIFGLPPSDTPSLLQRPRLKLWLAVATGLTLLPALMVGGLVPEWRPEHTSHNEGVERPTPARRSDAPTFPSTASVPRGWPDTVDRTFVLPNLVPMRDVPIPFQTAAMAWCVHSLTQPGGSSVCFAQRADCLSWRDSQGISSGCGRVPLLSGAPDVHLECECPKLFHLARWGGYTPAAQCNIRNDGGDAVARDFPALFTEKPMVPLVGMELDLGSLGTITHSDAPHPGWRGDESWYFEHDDRPGFLVPRDPVVTVANWGVIESDEYELRESIEANTRVGVRFSVLGANALAGVPLAELELDCPLVIGQSFPTYKISRDHIEHGWERAR